MCVGFVGYILGHLHEEAGPIQIMHCHCYYKRLEARSQLTHKWGETRIGLLWHTVKRFVVPQC